MKMTQQYDIKAMVAKIKALRRDAEALKKLAGDFPTVIKNADRILADIRMLEINVNDTVEILNK
jgi:hypothetical protein